MKLNKILVVLCGFLFLFGIASCSGNKEVNYKDGEYEGRSSDYTDDLASGYATCKITIESNAITACDIELYTLDGKLKDETYGSEYTDENKYKAQFAIQAASKYEKLVIGKIDPSNVDVIAGATFTYNEFVEAVNDALSKAEADESN